MRIIASLVAGGFLLALSGLNLHAQQEESAPDKYVSREEYEKLKSELDQLKAQMAELAKTEAPKSSAEGPSRDSKSVTADGAATAESDEIAELREEVAKVKETAASTLPGTTKFLLTGYAFAGFEKKTGEPSTFSAGFSPILLWKLSDKLFFEGELELGLEDGETHVNLEYAHLTYLLNDYITVGVGRFLTPFGQFPDRLHAAWINKLPDFPFVFNEDAGLVGFSQIGAEVRGVIPIGPTKLVYDAYVSNGPSVITDDPGRFGSLSYDNFPDNNNNKAVGGRIGFMPLPQLELGYSVQAASMRATDTSRSHANLLLQGVDLSYMRDIDWLKGGIDLRGEWVWSRVSRLTYDPDGTLGFGPVTFDNRRTGGYAQLAYRPYKVKLPVIDKLEAVVRFDTLNLPAGAAENTDEERWTFGLNYWLGQSTVLKAAFEFGHRDSPGTRREDIDGFLLQAAMGF